MIARTWGQSVKHPWRTTGACCALRLTQGGVGKWCVGTGEIKYKGALGGMLRNTRIRQFQRVRHNFTLNRHNHTSHAHGREPSDENRPHYTKSAEKRVGFHVECLPFLSDWNKAWNLTSSFSKTLQYQISRESVEPFSSCFTRTDGWTEEAVLTGWILGYFRLTITVFRDAALCSLVEINRRFGVTAILRDFPQCLLVNAWTLH